MIFRFNCTTTVFPINTVHHPQLLLPSTYIDWLAGLDQMIRERKRIIKSIFNNWLPPIKGPTSFHLNLKKKKRDRRHHRLCDLQLLHAPHEPIEPVVLLKSYISIDRLLLLLENNLEEHLGHLTLVYRSENFERKIVYNYRCGCRGSSTSWSNNNNGNRWCLMAGPPPAHKDHTRSLIWSRVAHNIFWRSSRGIHSLDWEAITL